MLNSAVIGQKSFEFAGHSIKPGEKKSIMLPIRAISGDSSFIPITIVHGIQTGPVLGLITGIHVYEYPPIMALQKLRASLNATDLKGTVIMVHIANVKAFFGRSVFYNPVEGKNVNRLFPGNESGTLSDVIAHTITTRIISRCQYLVDIYAGDANEDLHPYVALREFFHLLWFSAPNRLNSEKVNFLLFHSPKNSMFYSTVIDNKSSPNPREMTFLFSAV
jgi:predicted deacylase